MGKNNGVLNESPPRVEDSKVLTIQDVKKMVTRDLSVVSAFISALADPDVADVIATHLHGKYLNAKHKEELEKQVDLKL